MHPLVDTYLGSGCAFAFQLGRGSNPSSHADSLRARAIGGGRAGSPNVLVCLLATMPVSDLDGSFGSVRMCTTQWPEGELHVSLLAYFFAKEVQAELPGGI